MAFQGKWVIQPPRKTLVVGVADMVVSNDSSAEIVTYSLGSCLGISVYDPQEKIGGLLHIMLPDSNIDPVKGQTSPFMFVDTGVPKLFQSLFSLGADRYRVVAKVAGGAQLLDQQGIFNIGERNFKALSNMLARNNVTLQGTDVGGLSSRTMRMDLTTGKVTIKTPGNNLYFL